MPEDLTFATKPELGRQILGDLHAEGLLPGWVTGDEVYGRDPRLRAWLESEQVNTGYVLAISSSTRISLNPTATVRADAVLKTLLACDWVIDSCGTGGGLLIGGAAATAAS